jgi:hypothetical protein
MAVGSGVTCRGYIPTCSDGSRPFVKKRNGANIIRKKYFIITENYTFPGKSSWG